MKSPEQRLCWRCQSSRLVVYFASGDVTVTCCGKVHTFAGRIDRLPVERIAATTRPLILPSFDGEVTYDPVSELT
jgi:hypothetical protein